MWECYGKKCVYCGVAIEPRHMEIDHIIPSDESKIILIRDKDVNEYLEQLKNDGFEKDSIENYLVTCSDCNKKKKNYSFSASNFRFYHEYVKRHINYIIDKSEKVKRDINLNVEGSDLVNSNDVPFERKHYNEEELKCDLKVLNSFFMSKFCYGLGNVRIDAFLPVNYESEISCLINFKETYQTDLFITYNEKDIKVWLFSGYKTKFNSEERKWSKVYEFDEDNVEYEINLPNIKLGVSKDSLEEMAIITDSLYEEYLLQITNIINILGAEKFVEVRKGEYKMFSIDKNLWTIVWEFIQKHKYDMENTKWNIFHLTSSDDMFYLHKNLNSSEEADIYAQIKLSQSYNDILVNWKPGYLAIERDKMSNFDNILKWKLDYTYEWFLNELIPHALYEYYNSNISILDRLKGKRVRENNFSKEYLLENNLVKSYKE